MSEDKRESPTNNERTVMEGLIHRVLEKADEGDKTTPLLDVVLHMKAEALNMFDRTDPTGDPYLAACDTVAEFLKKHPNRSIKYLLRKRTQQT